MRKEILEPAYAPALGRLCGVDFKIAEGLQKQIIIYGLPETSEEKLPQQLAKLRHSLDKSFKQVGIESIVIENAPTFSVHVIPINSVDAVRSILQQIKRDNPTVSDDRLFGSPVSALIKKATTIFNAAQEQRVG